MHDIRNMTHKELRKLEDLWLERFHDSKYKDEPNAKRWLNALADFLDWRGDEVVPGRMRDEEHKLIERGLSSEYLSHLSQVVDSKGARSEEEWAILVLTATPEERTIALNAVLDEEHKRSKNELHVQKT